MTRLTCSKVPRIVGIPLAAVAATVIGGGCQLNVDPFTDELAHRPVVTTPSAEAARAAQVERRDQRRSFPIVEVPAKDGTVTHGVLYFEDPFEVAGSDDGRFAWTDEELLYFLYGSGRFVTNIVFFPINAAKNPPWLVMASDGRQTVRALKGKVDPPDGQADHGTKNAGPS